MPPIHVMVTFNQMDRGGAEMRFLEACRAISSRKLPFLFSIYVASGLPGQLDAEFRQTGVRIIYGKPGIRGVADLAAVCRRERPGVLHANGGLGVAAYLIAGWLASVPNRIANLRSMGYDENGLLRTLKNFAYRPLLHLFAHRVVGVAEGSRALSQTKASQWLTIYNGLEIPDCRLLGAPPSDRLSVLAMGRLIEAKNPLRLLPVIELLRRRGMDNVELRYVGAGPLADELSNQIAARGLETQVRLEGLSDNPVLSASLATVLALPSKREGLPGVVLEALSVGTPVVANDLPGVREIAHHVQGVIILPKAADDQMWAHALVVAAGQDRKAIANSFANSPFKLDKHIEQMTAVWSERRA